MLLKSQTSPFIAHNPDTVITSCGSVSSIGMPCTSNATAVAGSANISTAASGPPQYDISFVFQDSNKLAKNAKRSYESQVCDECVFLYTFCCRSLTCLSYVKLCAIR